MEADFGDPMSTVCSWMAGWESPRSVPVMWHRGSNHGVWSQMDLGPNHSTHPSGAGSLSQCLGSISRIPELGSLKSENLSDLSGCRVKALVNSVFLPGLKAWVLSAPPAWFRLFFSFKVTTKDDHAIYHPVWICLRMKMGALWI